MKEQISCRFLKDQIDSYFNDVFSNTEPEVLPDTPAGRVFSEIIEPHRGKILIVDFWGVYCGPCVYGIEQSVGMRSEYAADDDIAFIFITSEDESPLPQYNEIVAGNDLTHSYRVSEDDYLRLRELFRFNGIPRYALIDRQGRIVNRNVHFQYDDRMKIEEYKSKY